MRRAVKRVFKKKEEPVRPSLISDGPNLGLQSLYEPTNIDQNTVDIIFVHGLTGNAFKTWYHTASELHWPSALLKEHVQGARIYAFGYDANVASFLGGASQNRLSNHAEDMLGRIAGVQQDTNTEERKIIFVTHSLGGLVVERALQISQSSAEEHLQQIEASTIGILFFGTPHSGSDFAGFAKAVAKALKLSGKRVDANILETLHRDSPVLQDVEDWFGHWLKPRADAANSVQLTCFYEELALPIVGKVVEESQAKVTGYSAYPIHANHMEMTKFSSSSDPGYEAVCRELQRWVRTAGKKTATSSSDTQGLQSTNEEHLRYYGPRDQMKTEFLAKLYDCPYEDCKNLNSERVPGTCVWFTEHELFRIWSGGKTSPLLWVSADPGSGKSVLARHLVDNVLPRQGCLVCYFFFKDGFPNQQTASNAICAVLRQLFMQKPQLLSDGILRRSQQDGDNFFRSIHTLWGIFIDLAVHRTSEQVICIFDALDECKQGDLAILSNQVERFYLQQSQSKLRFLMTSRPYDHIRRAFRRLEDKIPIVHLSGEEENEVDKITKEIDLVIKSRVQSIGIERRLQDEECTHLENLLTATPNRTYLWVTLTLDVVEGISGFTRGSVLRAVRQLPQTVDEFYERILDRSSEAQSARKILHIVIGAGQPLTVPEVCIAMAIEEHHHTYEEIRRGLEPEERFHDTLRDLCGLFLVIIHERIYLLHQTARDFLVQNGHTSRVYGGSEFSSPDTKILFWKHSINLQVSERVLAQACLWYLSLRPMQGAFFDYALSHWNVHFHKADVQSNEKITRLALDFQRRLCGEDILWERLGIARGQTRGHETWQSLQGRTPLITASFFGLHQVVQLLVETQLSQIDLNSPDTDGRTSLAWAVILDHIDVVKVLLEQKKTDVDCKTRARWTPLHYAAREGNIQVAALLIHRGRADINGLSNHSGTPLCCTIDYGHEEMMKMLLATGKVDFNLARNCHPPLIMAASRGLTATVQVLLQLERLDMEARTENGSTSLILSAELGLKEVVKLLLATQKVDINATNEQGRTALMFAARKGFGVIVELLLDTQKVDVNAADIKGKTALLFAISCGYDDIVYALVKSGKVDLNTRDTNGSTPLSVAVGRMKISLIHLLLNTQQISLSSITGALEIASMENAQWRNEIIEHEHYRAKQEAEQDDAEQDSTEQERARQALGGRENQNYRSISALNFARRSNLLHLKGAELDQIDHFLRQYLECLQSQQWEGKGGPRY